MTGPNTFAASMDFENRIGADLDNVSQRLIYNYIDDHYEVAA